MNSKKKLSSVIGIAAAVILVLVVIGSAVCVIPTGYTGVKVTMGQASKDVLEPGLKLTIPFMQKVVRVDNRQQELEYSGTVWGESAERTAVYMADICLTYRINPEYSAWIYSNVSSYEYNCVPTTLLSSALKASSVQLSAAEVTNRSKIEPIALQCIQEALNEKYEGREVVTVVSVRINDMDFEDSYNEAIAAKQVAQLEYEQQQIVNRTSVEKAAAEAEVKKTQAEAEAEAVRIKAEAQADALRIEADAEAEANRTVSGSIDEKILQRMYYENWDGKLPLVTSDDPTPVVTLPAE